MRSFLFLSVLAAAGSTLAGCASVPPVTSHYYAPRSALDLKVVRTAGCDAQNQAILATSVVSSVVHTADPRNPRKIEFVNLGNALANSDFSLELTGDGG